MLSLKKWSSVIGAALLPDMDDFMIGWLVSVQKRIWWFEKDDVTLSPVILNVSKMYSDKDFQTFWFRYKTEGEPHGISINSFCINQGVPYKQFYAWFKKHAKDTVIPVE